MPRIACLFVPDWPLAALLRAEPELRGQPLAIVDRDDPRAPLVAVSPEAHALGLCAGLSAVQAKSVCATLVVRRVTGATREAATSALLDVAESFSPRVEEAGGGVLYLDLEGLSTLFGSEAHLGTSLGARARRVGLDARVGLAGSRIAARLAAGATDGVDVIPPGEESKRLAPLSLRFLDPPPEAARTLARWGIRTLGDLADLPAEAIGWRLGPTGLELRRRARGEDERPLHPRTTPPRYEEAVDCEYPVDSLEPLSFLLRGALERLVTRLDVRGLRAGDLELDLRLEGGGHERRVVRVAAPTAESKVLLALVRLNLEGRPPRAAVEAFRLRAVAERLRPVALDLFAPAGPSPDELDVALARLASVAGPDRLGAPAPAGSHRPEAFRLERFVAHVAPPAAVRARGSNARVLGLRAFRPAVPLEVACDRGRPDFLQTTNGNGGPHPHGRVVAAAGPWRLAGEWWREVPLARDYYDVEVSDGCVYRLYREHADGRWYAAGIYD